ncbi:MAG TPA: GNAT family N-acetyltransferase [Lentibacillus sp.]|uniref:GNAT family N-acetyltransferase n=1 Tax=Lentibacillus sp. TaxID=1925746 RepID=UPI002B4B29A7|nr:GNAT family N-acetyltransferase [Lentibacillus sp.]HLR60953.1 GNAT family N-acetyltransferase [Lentibacillus sp.]
MTGLFKMDTFESYNVRKAGMDDIHEVIRMLRDAAKWLIDKGIHQWDFYLTDEAALEVREAIKAGTTYLVKNKDDGPVATFNLSQSQNGLDTRLWGNRDDESLYLHRLAIDKNYRHKHIGKRLLRWIQENSQTGNNVLRLDCVADNPGLNQFYVNAGFAFSGYAEAMGIQFSMYEKPLNV